MRIVIDTNVIASGIFFSGLPNQLLRLVIERKILATVSNEIINEYHKTFNYLLNDKNRVPKENISVNSIVKKMKKISIKSDIKASRDPNDDMFINCAIDGKCKYIVSSDKDLLDIKSFENVEILTVREFMNEYNKK
ncbi:MAG: putative toxin-antitoxin system toxin component, PIN family [Chitinivibrionia bacterium]|nr:putative toxin-antitoxin system toxin component, PIN family [Chitinivibrionia bacterium]